MEKSSILPSSATMNLSRREIRILGVINAVIFAVVALRFAMISIEALVFGVSLAIAINLSIDACYWFYTRIVTKTMPATKALSIAIPISLFAGFALEAATIIGIPASSPLNFSEWNPLRLVFSIYLSFLLLTAIFFLRSHPARSAILRRLGLYVSLWFLITAGVIFFAWLTDSLPWSTSDAHENALFILLSCISTAVLVLFIHARRKFTLSSLFFVVAILAGSLLTLSIPPVPGISWDDEIHYARSDGLSFFGQGKATASEFEYVQRAWLDNEGLHIFDIEERVASIDQQYETDVSSYRIHNVDQIAEIGANKSLFAIPSVGAIPSAIGIWLGRLFALSFSWQFICGRLANLAFYAAVMAGAIRITPINKALLAGIGLIPTSIFLASNYSYDPWSIAFISLGCALVLREIAQTDRKLTIPTFILMMSALVVGIMPKAIYFPILAIAFFMPKEKFSATFIQRRYRRASVLIVALMVLSFVLPLLFSPAVQAGDPRGGNGVNSVEQVVYILTNPFQYALTLLKFLAGYLSPLASGDYSLSFGYLGSLYEVIPAIVLIPLILLIVLAYSPWKKGESILSVGQRLTLCGALLVTVVLIVTALYVSFNPVGAHVIKGVQVRYLLPLLFPFFLVVFSGAVPQKSAVTLVDKSALSIMGILDVVCVAILAAYVGV
ncbi:DUF2142 domain-containing protein [Arcanobacterium pinnipediorum]|uniref:DUF2142 domain-containing protein n=1 Tax=Arcanobacterium pinnipediorum TaxID=1503041 RepID=A0ABY5AGX7_9ACTO|nr:DUF2142 domain-containing protein [Arcanobacterium pinnipediorum]USR79458.1 DUF2142 domain-containing protein [Arcanobacterium pinnipediorum]